MVSRIKILGSEKTGFTLAEVLITLTIIGVIAALTIPSLITSYQNKVYATRLENFFSTTNAGFRKIMADKGCSDIPCTGIIGNSTNLTTTNIQNTGVFNIIKRCDVLQSGCHDTMIYELDSTSVWVPSAHYSLIVTNDGVVWGFYASGGVMATDCSYNVGSGSLANACNEYGLVDVNGQNPPNQMGRDIFRFYVLNDGRVVPTGMDNDTRIHPWWSNTSSIGYCDTSAQGEGCAARIAQEGWQMNY